MSAASGSGPLRVLLLLGFAAFSALAIDCYVSDTPKYTPTSSNSMNVQSTTTVSGLAACFTAGVDILVISTPEVTIKGTYASGLAGGACNRTSVEKVVNTVFPSALIVRGVTDWNCCITSLCNTGTNLDLTIGAAVHSASLIAILLAAVLAMLAAHSM